MTATATAPVTPRCALSRKSSSAWCAPRTSAAGSAETRSDLIDVDNLKKINDRNGHRAGDAALRLVAQELQRVLRASDVCGRIGGDEFAVAMPETDLHRAREVARRLRTANQAMNLGSSSIDSVEVSIGLGSWRPGMDWQAVTQMADTELYEDKRHRKE